MRALWSIVVVCLVAATGARPVPVPAIDVHGDPAISRAHHAPELVARAAASSISPRRQRSPDRSGAVVVATPAPELRAPSVTTIALACVTRGRFAQAPVTTRSSRGPPIS